MNEFRNIFENLDTDKAENYSVAYEECFSGIRDDISLVFEIGVQRGGSVKGWKEYFPNALIVGIDINPECFFEDDRITVEIGDAADRTFVDYLLNKYGRPDIIIDDGSHFSSDIKKSYDLLYDHAKVCYVIEDYGTQFMEFRGGFYINDSHPATIIAHKEIDKLLFDKEACKSIHIYHSICLMFK